MSIIYVPEVIMSLSSFSNTMNHKYVTKLVGKSLRIDHTFAMEWYHLQREKLVWTGRI